MNKFPKFTIGCVLALSCLTSAKAQTAFTDDFNRPDGPVGNGWFNTTGNLNGDLVIRSGAVSTPGPGGDQSAGIYRPISLAAPVTISATLTHGNGFGGLLNRYTTTFLVGNNGNISGGGYSVTFYRGDQTYPSHVILNGFELTSSFQFGASITTTFTVSPDGSVAGSVSGSGNTFNFSSGPSAVVPPGSNLAIVLGFPDTRSAVITNPTVDDLSITTASSTPLKGNGAVNIDSVPIGAGFQISGPGLTHYSGTTPFAIKNTPVGTYTITWNIFGPGFLTPLPETKTLEEKQTIRFVGGYVPAGGVQPNRPIPMSFDSSGRTDITQTFANPTESGPHTGIDYRSPLGNPIFNLGAGGVIHGFTGPCKQGFGSREILPKDNLFGPAIWVKYQLVSGDPIYVLYGHTASTWAPSAPIGAESRKSCIATSVYTVNWGEGDPVGANVLIGLTAPFSDRGVAAQHLHLSVFKPFKTCSKNSFCEPPASGWGYGVILPKSGDGEFIDPEQFFSNPVYKLMP